MTLLAGILEGVVMVVNDGHTVGASDGLSGLPVVNWSRDHGDPRHLGAEIGFFSVLHSWNQHLQFHPHIHCVVAAGGPARDQSSWISARRSSFLPIGILSRVFRGKFVAGLRHAFHQGRLQFHGSLASLSHPHAFSAWLRVLFRHHWVVYSKPPFGGPEHVLRYLGAYTRLLSLMLAGLSVQAANGSTKAELKRTAQMAVRQLGY